MSDNSTIQEKPKNNKKTFIALCGILASGKTTLTEKLCEKLNLKGYYEKVIDNKHLNRFYNDMKKHAYAFQIYLLNNRFEQQQQIIWSKNGGIQDRSIYEDSIFCEMLKNDGLIEQLDYETYKNLFNNMKNFMQKPDILLYLNVSPETSLKRLKERNRECETGVTLEYLKKLKEHYDKFIEEIKNEIEVIIIEYNQDYINIDNIVQVLNKRITNKNNVTYI